MNIADELFNAASSLLKARFPKGPGGAAALRTESGKILTSIAPATKNDALALCMEVGAILQAHKLGEAITHMVAVCRENKSSELLILSPCGICQERLVHWGGDVLVAITNPEHKLILKPIRELQPYHWSAVNGEEL
ncbi:MAG: cytidine deaminase [SAR86 cluster bacterium]|uniref:Cytidine deaminase n=1 Tax=SAR86 cluster bacterium TaxID=2030880 RepID=A0A2A5CJ43_9GAMM|nr:cytidine deaminase [Gammaproteobacteria bacterium AH-315-E17]PCJ43521.1 MAG: cytidine deaminase [SAR86 cluster bacterium]